MTERDNVRETLQELGPEYELIRELGRGATAVVYLVWDHELDRDLALKVIRPSFVRDEEAVARLQREARLVAGLQHPNIVRVFGTRRLPDSGLALLMEHVPGRNLKEILRAAGPFGPARALDVLVDVASALAYAHRRRIVHRDVKPENIYLDEEIGTARLADFGIARPWDRDARLTVPGEALGTPAYMSPEQIEGGAVDARSDVYSLGLVGYEMLAGEHPWEDDNLFQIIFKQKNEDPPPLSDLRADLPPALVRVIGRALRKDPEARWESAEAFVEPLQALASRLGPPEAGGDRDRARRPAVGVRAPMRRPTGPDAPPDEGPPVPAGVDARPPAPDAGEPTGTTPAPVPLDSPTPLDSPIGAERTGSRWRTGRLAATAGVLALVLAGIWSWTAWAGGGGGWVSLDAVEGPESAEVEPTPLGGGSNPGAPAADSAAAPLEVAVGESREGGMVGTTVPLAVRVPAGARADPVRFRVVEGGAVVEPERTEAGADGIARASVRLPEQPGPVTVEAFPEDRPEDGIQLRLAATAGPPQSVRTIQGDGQTGDPGAPLPQAIGVEVVDALDNPVREAEVRFQVLTGEGGIAPERVRTDSLGRAWASWRLGTAPGAQQAAALVPSAEESTVVFQGTARAAATDPEDQILPLDPAAASPDDPVDPTAELPGSDTGSTDPEPTAPAPVAVAPRPLSVGGTAVCVLDDRGFPRCSGAPGVGDAGALQIRLAALAAGVRHVCGLDATGAGFCWGANDVGQLGDGSTDDHAAPIAVQTATTFSRLALGLSHSCGLAGGGRVLCWGTNESGQLGNGSRGDGLTPGPITGLAATVDVVAGWNHSCALGVDGRASCWGLNSEGQLGDGTRGDQLSPISVAGAENFSALAAGSAHTCGVARGAVHCWGADGSGQLGIGDSDGQTRPVRLESLPGAAVQVTAGAVHTCALIEGGGAWCWGQNIHGQLGDGSTTDRRLPVPVSGGLRFRSLEAGGGSTCGVSLDGDRFCWGLNQAGQLGDGTRANRSEPTRSGG